MEDLRELVKTPRYAKLSAAAMCDDGRSRAQVRRATCWRSRCRARAGPSMQRCCAPTRRCSSAQHACCSLLSYSGRRYLATVLKVPLEALDGLAVQVPAPDRARISVELRDMVDVAVLKSGAVIAGKQDYVVQSAQLGRPC